MVADAPTVRHPGVLLLILGMMTGIGPFSIDMYLPALPRIADDFHAAASVTQLTLTACLLGLAVGQLLVGPLSDRFGRRRPAAAGLVVYVLAALGCAAAPTAELLTAARFVQGLAGGATVVIARAVVRDLYHGADAAAYFSRLVLVFGVAPVIAPSIGGFVLRLTDWRGVFVVLAGIGALVLAAVLAGLPETLPPARRHPGGVVATLRGIGMILRDRAYVGYVLGMAFAGAALFAYISGSSFVLQRVYGASPQLYGLLFGLNALSFVLVGQVNGRLVRRYPTRRVLAVAQVLLLAAAVAFGVATHWSSLVAVAVPLAVFMGSLGMVLPDTTALALDLHPERAGAASALLGASQSLLGAAAAPLVGLGGEDTALPMALTMIGAAVVSLAAFLTGVAGTRKAAPEPVGAPPR